MTREREDTLFARPAAAKKVVPSPTVGRSVALIIAPTLDLDEKYSRSTAPTFSCFFHFLSLLLFSLSLLLGLWLAAQSIRRDCVYNLITACLSD